MYCSHCGAGIPDDSAFCPNCGTPTSASSSEPVIDAAQAAVEETVQEAAAPSAEPIQEAASESVDDALARLKAEMDAESAAASQATAPAVAPVIPVAASAEPARYVESVPAASASAAPNTPAPAPAYTPAPAPAQQTIPAPAPVQQAYAPQPTYAPPAPTSQQAPGYAYQPAASTGAPMGAAPAKKSPIAKIAIAAVVLALAGFLVFTFFGNSGDGGGTSGGGGTPTPAPTPAPSTDYDLFDAKGNPTLYSVVELTGAEFTQAIEDEGFSWNSERLWWESSDGNDCVYVSGNNDYEFSRSEIGELDRNASGTSCIYVIVVDDRDYKSSKDAFDKLANIDVVDSEWIDDGLGLAVVSGPSGGNSIVLVNVNDDIGLYVLNVFNEEAVDSGLLEEYLGDDYGSSIAEVWDNLFGRTIDGGRTGASTTAPSLTTAPSTPTVGTLSQGAVGSIPPGSYIVGEGLPSGEYKLYADADTSGYYAVYADNSSTEIEDIVNNSVFESCCYVTLQDGQYVEFERCSLDPISSCSATADWSASGIYKIGLDIPAGTVTLTPDGEDFSGFYTVFSTSDPVTMYDSVVAIDMIDGPVSIEVSEGQYLSISFCSVDIQQ